MWENTDRVLFNVEHRHFLCQNKIKDLDVSKEKPLVLCFCPLNPDPLLHYNTMRPRLFISAAAIAIVKQITAFPHPGNQHLSRQSVNCTDLQASTDPSCWQRPGPDKLAHKLE